MGHSGRSHPATGEMNQKVGEILAFMRWFEKWGGACWVLSGGLLYLLVLGRTYGSDCFGPLHRLVAGCASAPLVFVVPHGAVLG